MLPCSLRFFLFGLTVVLGQWPSTGHFGAVGRGSPSLDGSFGRPQSGQAASQGEVSQAFLRDVVEGIGGLMQRFEQFQPQLGSLPRVELEGIAREAQQLHGRFLELQQRMNAAGGGVAASEETQVIGFHRDLALFVARVEGKLGIMGPVPPPQTAQDRLSNNFPGSATLSEQGVGSATTGGSSAQSINERLQAAMKGIVDGMQRFEALHPKLRNLPQQIFSEIARRGQKLHEDFVVLQRRGVELSGQGGQTTEMSEAQAVPYAAQLEAFVVEQAAFVRDAEAQLQSSVSVGGGLPPASGLPGFGQGSMLGSQLPMSGGSATGLGQGALGAASGVPFAAGGASALSSGAPPSMPQSAASFGSPLGSAGALGASAQTAGARVSPATDKRLSDVISKVVARMQEFEAIKPQLGRLPREVFAKVAQQGQELNDRFVALQQRGVAIAGDGSVTMLEQDASFLASEMERFHKDQLPFVEGAKEALQSGSGSVMSTNLGAASLGSFGLGNSGFGVGGGGFATGGSSQPGLGQPEAGLAGPSPASLGGGFGGFRQAGPSAGLGGSPFGGPSSAQPSLGANAFGGQNLGGGNAFGGQNPGNLGGPGFR